MAYADLLRIFIQGPSAVALTPLILFFKARDLRKTEEKKDSSGPKGVLFALAVMGFASVLFAAVGNLLIRLMAGGFNSSWDYLIVSLYAGLALVFALLINWSYKAHRRRMLDTPPEG